MLDWLISEIREFSQFLEKDFVPDGVFGTVNK